MNEEVMNEQTTLSRAQWVQRAIVLAWISVAYNLLEGGLSVAFGWAERSISLFGFGADSLVEVGTALLVLWRMQAEAHHHHEDPAMVRRERRGVMAAGVLFLVLAAGMVLGCLDQLRLGRHPETTLPGVIIAIISLAVMAALWVAKKRTVTALDSRTLASDVACTEACMQLSAILLVGSLLDRLSPRLWWADAAAGLVLAVLIAREGIAMVQAARKPEFHGGCGCAH